MYQSGWVVANGFPIVIEAKDDTNVITAIEAEIYSGGGNYSYVRYSSGEKAETGGVADYSAVHVNNISSSRLEIYCDNSNIQFNRITVYYTHDHHNFACDGVDNGDGTHSLKCTDCDEYGSPVSHSYRPVTKISDSPLTYTAKCTDCPNTIDNFIINNPVSFNYTGFTRYQDVEKDEILKGGTNLKAEYKWGDAKMIIYIDGEKSANIKPGEYWTASQCVKCLDYDSDWITFDDTVLTMWFETVCDYTLATCESPSTCIYCGRTVAEATGHKWKNATCTEAKICIRCGETDGDPLGHNFGDWAVVTEATATTDGLKRRECTRCDTFEEEVIPATGEPEEPEADVYVHNYIITFKDAANINAIRIASGAGLTSDRIKNAPDVINISAAVIAAGYVL